MAIELSGLAPLLQVFDMPRSVSFYRDVLGFEVAQHSPERGAGDFDWCLLRRGDLELMLNTAYEHDRRPGQPQPARQAAHADTSLYFGVRDLDAAHAWLAAHGVDAAPPAATAYGMQQLHFSDPDGYRVCLQWPAQDAR